MENNIPVLYSFRRCPYAIRARLAIARSDKRVELREILLRDKPQQMLDASPKGTVPVLVFNDGTVIDESRDIIEWALPASPVDATLVDRNDGEFKAWLDKYKYADRHPEHSREFYRENAVAFLETLNARLRPTSQLDDTSVTDLAIFPFVRQFAFVDKNWFDANDWPALHAWLNRWLGSKEFSDVMAKLPPWQPGDETVEFP